MPGNGYGKAKHVARFSLNPFQNCCVSAIPEPAARPRRLTALRRDRRHLHTPTTQLLSSGNLSTCLRGEERIPKLCLRRKRPLPVIPSSTSTSTAWPAGPGTQQGFHIPSPWELGVTAPGRGWLWNTPMCGFFCGFHKSCANFQLVPS